MRGVPKIQNFHILFVCYLTRTELPSCEAINVRKVNIGSIVTKLKAGKNLKGQTDFKAGTNF